MLKDVWKYTGGCSTKRSHYRRFLGRQYQNVNCLCGHVTRPDCERLRFTKFLSRTSKVAVYHIAPVPLPQLRPRKDLPPPVEPTCPPPHDTPPVPPLLVEVKSAGVKGMGVFALKDLK